ncbi:MAG: carbohydrate porin, partial [Microcystis aeruginosa]
AQGIDSSADLWTWQGNFSIRDFVKEGATFTIAGGQLPRVSYVEGFTADRDTSHILEVEYSYPISRYVLLTPGF